MISNIQSSYVQSQGNIAGGGCPPKLPASATVTSISPAETLTLRNTQFPEIEAISGQILTNRQISTPEYINNTTSPKQIMVINLFTAIKHNDFETVKLHISEMPNAVVNQERNSALSQALWRDKPDAEMIKLLLDNRADPNVEIAKGRLPLQRAVELQNLTLAQLLISAGGDPDKEASCGKNAVEFAREFAWLPMYHRYLSPSNINHADNDFSSDHRRELANQIFNLMADHSKSFHQDDVDPQVNNPEYPSFEIGHWEPLRGKA